MAILLSDRNVSRRIVKMFLIQFVFCLCFFTSIASGVTQNRVVNLDFENVELSKALKSLRALSFITAARILPFSKAKMSSSSAAATLRSTGHLTSSARPKALCSCIGATASELRPHRWPR